MAQTPDGTKGPEYSPSPYNSQRDNDDNWMETRGVIPPLYLTAPSPRSPAVQCYGPTTITLITAQWLMTMISKATIDRRIMSDVVRLIWKFVIPKKHTQLVHRLAGCLVTVEFGCECEHSAYVPLSGPDAGKLVRCGCDRSNQPKHVIAVSPQLDEEGGITKRVLESQNLAIVDRIMSTAPETVKLHDFLTGESGRLRECHAVPPAIVGFPAIIILYLLMAMSLLTQFGVDHGDGPSYSRESGLLSVPWQWPHQMGRWLQRCFTGVEPTAMREMVRQYGGDEMILWTMNIHSWCQPLSNNHGWSHFDNYQSVGQGRIKWLFRPCAVSHFNAMVTTIRNLVAVVCPGITRVAVNPEEEWIGNFPGNWSFEADRWSNRQLRLAEAQQDSMERNDRRPDYAVRWGARRPLYDGTLRYGPILRNPVDPIELTEYASPYGSASGLKPRGLCKGAHLTNEAGEIVEDCLKVQAYYVMDSEGRYNAGKCKMPNEGTPRDWAPVEEKLKKRKERRKQRRKLIEALEVLSLWREEYNMDIGSGYELHAAVAMMDEMERRDLL